jgi:predicted RNase H-like HicB family nuclease
MRYPIAIEPGDATHAFGVVIPDLPGCFSAGDTLDEAINNAYEAVELWLETMIADGGSIPRSFAEHQANPEFSGWIWAIVIIDPAALKSGNPAQAARASGAS